MAETVDGDGGEDNSGGESPSSADPVGEFRRALASDPDNLACWLDLARALADAVDQGALAANIAGIEALALAREALARDPGNAAAAGLVERLDALVVANTLPGEPVTLPGLDASADPLAEEGKARPPGVRARKRATLRGLFSKASRSEIVPLSRANPSDASDGLRSEEAKEISDSLFPGISEAVVDEIAIALTARDFANGDVVLREGEPGDACYLIESGRVRVFKRDPKQPRGDFLEVTQLGPGELFGEFALLGDRRRHATVVAAGTLRLLEISHELFSRLCSEHPSLRANFEAAYRDRLLDNLVRTAPLFDSLEPDGQQRLLAQFSARRVAAGEVLIEQGSQGGAFFLIVLGGVEITKRLPDSDANVTITQLREGDYFGELSLLRGDVARATVRATGPTELVMLGAKDFYALMSEHPVLWTEVHEQAHRRELEIHSLVAGQTPLT